MTMVVVTHEMGFAREVATKVILWLMAEYRNRAGLRIFLLIRK